jgi:hypothetical protein
MLLEGAPLGRRKRRVRVTISTRKVIRALAVVVLILTVAGLAVQVYKIGPLFGSGSLGALDGDRTIQAFDLEEEANIPTWYSSATLLLCAGLLALIGAAKTGSGERYAGRWYGLSLVFLVMSVDESATLHEKVGSAISRMFETGGLLYYAWVIPAAAFLAVLGLLYLGFFASLPTDTKWLFLAAGLLYVGGAFALEMLEGLHNDLYSKSDVMSAVLGGGQDVVEMLGVLVFVYALMSYIGRHLKDLHFRIK